MIIRGLFILGVVLLPFLPDRGYSVLAFWGKSKSPVATCSSVSAGTVGVASEVIRVASGNITYTPTAPGGTASAGAASFSVMVERLF